MCRSCVCLLSLNKSTKRDQTFAYDFISFCTAKLYAQQKTLYHIWIYNLVFWLNFSACFNELWMRNNSYQTTPCFCCSWWLLSCTSGPIKGERFMLKALTCSCFPWLSRCPSWFQVLFWSALSYAWPVGSWYLVPSLFFSFWCP